MRRSKSEFHPVILVAEDNDTLRARIARSLRIDGWGVLEAKTSLEALLMAVAFDGPIEALVTSLELRAYCNGPEMADCLRVSRPEMRVVYLSEGGYPDEQTLREVVAGEAELMPSPASPSQLMALVAEVKLPRTALAERPRTTDWVRAFD